ncbi:MAG: P-II family nitrogen regulator [Candidatus Omnitrophica bacterium]|nr:P-II family nitrogen regulator [Candidatus Omnitrophota bacterium]
MKKIEAIIRPAKTGDVCDALNKIGHPGIMITEIEGHGKQKGLEQRFRDKTYRTEFLSKAKLELIVSDADVEKIAGAIRQAAFTGNVGDGKIFVYPVDDAIRIRTAEQGEVAV